MEIRDAIPADAEGISRMQERTWQAAYRHVFPEEDLDRGGFIQPARWRTRLERPPRGWSTFVAALDDEIVGFSAVGPSRDENGIGELYALYVTPEQWSTGTGRALIEHAELTLRATFAEATLWVLEDNPRARRFYERAGWVPDGASKAEERWNVLAPEVRYRKTLA